MIPNVVLRRAVRVAIAIFVGMLVCEIAELPYGIWISLVIILVMQSTSGATLRCGWQRFIGLIIGVFIGSLLLQAAPTLLWQEIIVIIVASVTFSMRLHYALHDSRMAIMMMVLMAMMLAMLTPPLTHNMVIYRLIYVGIGTVIALLVTLTCFPTTLQDKVEMGVQHAVKQSAFYAAAIFAMFAGKDEAAQKAQDQRTSFVACLRHYRHYFRDWLYEFGWLRKSRRRQYNQLIPLAEELGQVLMSMHVLAQQKWPVSLRKEITKVLEGVDDKIKHLVATICLQAQAAPLVSEVDDFTEHLAEIHAFYLVALKKHDSYTIRLLSWLISDLQQVGKLLQAMLQH